MDERRGLQVVSALIGIVAGSIIVGISDSFGAATVGGIFLGAAGFGLLASIIPILQAWQCGIPGHLRVQPLHPARDQETVTENCKVENKEIKDLATGHTGGPSSTQHR